MYSQFKKEGELCTLCGAFVAIMIFSSSNKVYSCGHPSTDLIMDNFLGENRRHNSDAPNPTVSAHQNVNVNEINNELMLENSLEQQKKYEKSLQGLRKEFPYEQLHFMTLKSWVSLWKLQMKKLKE